MINLQLNIFIYLLFKLYYIWNFIELVSFNILKINPHFYGFLVQILMVSLNVTRIFQKYLFLV